MLNIESRLVRVTSEHDPERCKAEISHGQCWYKTVPGAQYCALHKGDANLASIAKAKTDRYRIEIWQQRLDELSNSPRLKNLHDEIAIIRLLLENILQTCETTTDLIMHSQRIGDLVTKVEKLVVSCHSLEKQTSSMMDKTTAISFAGSIIDIITCYVTDPQILENISGDIMKSLAAE